MGMLHRRFYHDADSNTLRMLYTISVRPLLEYAVPVWDPHLVKDIEAIESPLPVSARSDRKTLRSEHAINHRLNSYRDI